MKGLSIMTVLMATSLILSAIIVGLTLKFGSSLDEKARLETLPITEKRIESSIYMASGLEEGKIQLNFRTEYGLDTHNGKKLVNYSSDAEMLTGPSEATAELNPPVSFTLSEEGRAESFCIEKNSDITLTPGEC